MYIYILNIHSYIPIYIYTHIYIYIYMYIYIHTWNFTVLSLPPNSGIKPGRSWWMYEPKLQLGTAEHRSCPRVTFHCALVQESQSETGQDWMELLTFPLLKTAQMSEGRLAQMSEGRLYKIYIYIYIYVYVCLWFINLFIVYCLFTNLFSHATKMSVAPALLLHSSSPTSPQQFASSIHSFWGSKVDDILWKLPCGSLNNQQSTHLQLLWGFCAFEVASKGMPHKR